jgi:hypothetical protein
MGTPAVTFYEKTTPVITGYFKDGTSVITVEELVVTIYDADTKQIVNSKDNLSVTVSDYVNGTTGYMQYPLEIGDTTVVRQGSKPGDVIEHIVRFDYRWNSLSRSNSTLISLKILNLDHK